MKTFKEFSEKETKEFNEKQNEALKKFKKEHRINNILLFGINDFGSSVISEIKDIPKVTKLFSNTDKKQLDKSNKNNTFLFLQDYKLSKGLWDKNNYSKIYKHLIAHKEQIIEKIKNYDYIIICTRSGDKMDSCIAKALADICNEINKQFMICHTRGKFAHMCFLDIEKLTKRISQRFVNIMKKKKYLINEIEEVSTSLVSTKADFEYKCKKYSAYSFANSDLTYGTKFNIKIFANVVEYNIIKMLEA